MSTIELMTLGEVWKAFQVHPRTVTRWADTGALVTIRTPGRQRRYVAFQVKAMLTNTPLTPEQEATLRDLAGQS